MNTNTINTMKTNINTTRPTPETDAESINGAHHPQFGLSDLTRKLERKRDEAREWQNVKVTKNGETHCLGTLIDLLERERDEAFAKASTVYRWIERNHPDGFIDSQSHLENLDRVADAWHDKLEDMQRELGKTRDQLKAMREAIREAGHILGYYRKFTPALVDLPEDIWLETVEGKQVLSALAKLKPFIAPLTVPE
jgi:hypothetical protein